MNIGNRENCKRCGGPLFIQRDPEGDYISCIDCGAVITDARPLVIEYLRREPGLKDAEIARRCMVSRQRVHQIRTEEEEKSSLKAERSGII